MSSVVISGNTSGAVTLSVPDVAGTNTATLPATTGTVMVSGNMPAFSAYQSAGTSLTISVTTKVLFATEEFDTNNNFASSTFTPTVAGYYQVNACVGMNSTAAGVSVWVYKNGSAYKATTNPVSSYQCAISCLVYCNGSTDYLEVYCKQTSATQTTDANAANTWFQASLVRSA